jgi:hypothetical protein
MIGSVTNLPTTSLLLLTLASATLTSNRLSANSLPSALLRAAAVPLDRLCTGDSGGLSHAVVALAEVRSTLLLTGVRGGSTDAYMSSLVLLLLISAGCQLANVAWWCSNATEWCYV